MIKQVGTRAKHVKIVLMQVLMSMPTNSLQYINVRNLSGLRVVVSVVNVIAILQRCTGIQKYTSTVIIQQMRKYITVMDA